MIEKLVTVITTTGYRPEALALCKDMMSEQTFVGEVQWLIVCDNPEEMEEELQLDNWRIQYIPGPLTWKPGINTQRYNLEAARPYIKGDYIIIAEDDDIFKNTYIEEYVKLLDSHQVVGECGATYYNVGHRCWKEMENYQHASLCQTAFRKEVLDTFYQAVHSGEIYIDIVFWKLVQKERLNWNLFAGKNLCIGIKGMPGRPGIGVGHAPIGYVSDPYYGKLTSLVGKEYTEIYKKFLISK